ncbi:MAG: phosphoglycerate dehydrogenase [bacterium]|nr:phosphoglycerate dehydrogenase [bacterium]
MTWRVLVTSRSFGKISDEPVNLLRENGIEVDFLTEPREEDVLKVIEKYDAMVVGNDKITRGILEKAKNLKIICKHGVGVDNIDLESAKEFRVTVTNVPSTNSDAVADLAFGLIIDLARRITATSYKVKNGKWEPLVGVDVHRKILGIIGLGAIGKKVAKRAIGFDMTVLAYDPYIDNLPDEISFVRLVSLEDVLKNADFLTIHTPLTDKTKGLIGEKEISIMKKGSFIINTAREGIVDESALYKYLQDGHLGGAGLDVVDKNSPVKDLLLSLDNVIILPHMGMYSKETINSVSMVCAQNIVKMFLGKPPDNIVV